MIAQNYDYRSSETKVKRLCMNLSIARATCRTAEQHETLSQITPNKHNQGGRQIGQGREGRKRRRKRWRGDWDEKSKWNKKEK